MVTQQNLTHHNTSYESLIKSYTPTYCKYVEIFAGLIFCRRQILEGLIFAVIKLNTFFPASFQGLKFCAPAILYPSKISVYTIFCLPLILYRG